MGGKGVLWGPHWQLAACSLQIVDGVAPCLPPIATKGAAVSDVSGSRARSERSMLVAYRACVEVQVQKLGAPDVQLQALHSRRLFVRPLPTRTPDPHTSCVRKGSSKNVFPKSPVSTGVLPKLAALMKSVTI